MANIVLEVHPLLVPGLTARQQNESSPVQRVKRMSDLNPPMIVATTCS
jgi:hypothetical protein